jgi:tetratricopeptide (TPR) repeat protein
MMTKTMTKKPGLPTCIGFSLAVALATAFPAARAADDSSVQKLIDQARYWQQKKRDDLAAEAWKKLLRTDPNHPLALVQLGSLEALAGHSKEAEELYQRAKALNPQPVGIGELETALKVQKAAPTELTAARKQAQSGQAEQAVKSYQTILGDTRPAGQFGLEYYQTLGGTREGWDEARRGMEQLARNNPGDARYLLALGRHLTYRESTRREGIRQLAALAQQDGVAQDAQKAWRQALVWLNARIADRPLFQHYLQLFANDQAIRERVRQLDRPNVVPQKPNLADLERQAGFRWLDTGDVDQAEARFKAILAKKPRDLDAQGGLASVMMRRGLWVEASALLDQVVASGGKRWRNAQQSAHYWTLMSEINEARQSDPNANIEAKLQQLLRIDGKEPAGLVILADLVAEKRDFARAEPLYRQVLQRQPQNAGAFLGLVSLLTQTGREQQALALIAAQNGSGELKMVGLNQTKANALLKLAQADEQAGAIDTAAQRLEDALLLDPTSPWIRLALARLYQRLGDPAGANALIDNLVDTFPDLPEALHARALLFAEQERPSEALLVLERIPPNKRSAAMAQDQRRLWVQVQVERARQLYQAGQGNQSLALLNAAQQAAGNDLGLLGSVAGGFSDTGQAARAVQILRELHSKHAVSDLGSRIQYASLLLNTQQDAELATVLRDLSRQTNLSSKQFDDINKIILAWTLRQTDTLREAGRLAEAWDTVTPALAQSNDPRLVMALARLYQSAGEPEQALPLAESVIAQEPDNLDHRLFAAGAAMAAKQLDKAQEHANAALELAPDHPRALATIGRVEKLRGNVSRALEYFQYAQALERDKGAFANVPGNLALRLVDANPSLPSLITPQAAPRNQLLPLPNALRAGAGVPATGVPAAPVAPAGNRLLPLGRGFTDPLNNAPVYPPNGAPNTVPGSSPGSSPYSAPGRGVLPPAPRSIFPTPAPAAPVVPVVPLYNAPASGASLYPPGANVNASAPVAGNPASLPGTSLDTIYQAAYQAALDSFGGNKTERKRRSKRGSRSARNLASASSNDNASLLNGNGPGAGIDTGPAVGNDSSVNPRSERRSSKRGSRHSKAARGSSDALNQALAALAATSSTTPTARAATDNSPGTAPGYAAPLTPNWRATTQGVPPATAPATYSATGSTAPDWRAAAPASAAEPRSALPSLSGTPGGTPGTLATTLGTPNASARAAASNYTGNYAGNAAGNLAPAAQNPNREKTLAEEIAEIELKFTTTIDVAAAFRNRSGEVGLNRLSEIELPLEIKTSLDYDHRLTLRITPVLLSAGELILADPANSTRFGSGALGPFLSRPYPNAVQEASGVALGVAFDDEHLHADIGTTPLGFKIRNVVGGLSYTNTVDNLTLKASYNRRAVSDSILSYAGANDPQTGQNFGGVVKSGFRLDAALGDEQYGFFGGVATSELTGTRVRSNSEWELLLGGYYRVLQNLNHKVTLGANLNAFGYANNLSHFTLGHGGYFSPQRYVALTLPIEAAGRFGRLSYQVGIDPGVRHSVQDRNSYFPQDDTLQIAWQTRIINNVPLLNYQAFYAGDTSSSFGANFRAQFEYLIAPKFALGGRLTFDSSRNYNQQTGLLYLRYSFSPLPQPVAYPPHALRTLNQGEPL